MAGLHLSVKSKQSDMKERQMNSFSRLNLTGTLGGQIDPVLGLDSDTCNCGMGTQTVLLC